MRPTVLATHRGYTITDEPYGSEPFTIYTPEGRVLDHCDEETIKECIDTIDIIQDEHEAAERREDERNWHPGSYFSKRGGYPETYL
jgi:hypothetical protein